MNEDVGIVFVACMVICYFLGAFTVIFFGALQ